MTAQREALFIFCGFFLVYAITSPGDLVGDSEMRWLIATRLVDTGWFDLAPGSASRCVVGTGGRLYFFTGPGQPVCLAPFVLAGRAAAALAPGFKAGGDMFGQFLASLVFFPACGALAVALLYAVVREAAGDRRAALWSSIIFGLGTMHWHNSVNSYEESQTAVFALLGLWAVQRAWRRGGWVYPWLACLAMGLNLCFRVSSVTLSAPLGLVAVAADVASRTAAAEKWWRAAVWAAAGLAGVGPFVAVLAAFNLARFGSVFETGYGLHVAQTLGMGLFDTPLLAGLGGMLFSPGKSVFLFNPVLLLAIPGLAALWRMDHRLAAVAALTFAATVLFHARYTFWSGDLAWGPRYLASSLGFVTLALVPLVNSRRWRVALISLLAASICVQAASVTYSFGLEFAQDRRHGTVPDGYVWRPAESQLFCRFRNIGLHLAGRPDYRSIPPARECPIACQVTTPPEVVKRQHAVQFFPFKALAVTGNRKMYYGLLAAWAAMLAAIGVLLRIWQRSIGRQSTLAGQTVRPSGFR